MTGGVPRKSNSISKARAGDRRQERKPKPLQVRVVGQLSRKSLGISHKKPYANRPGSALVPHLLNVAVGTNPVVASDHPRTGLNPRLATFFQLARSAVPGTD